jgi:hypothetical protein
MATHKQKLFKKYDIPKDATFTVSELSKLFGIPKKYLQEVYNRGVGAHSDSSGNISKSVRLISGEKYYGNLPLKRMSKEAWGMSRLYSFLNKGKTYKTTDSDIAEKIDF